MATSDSWRRLDAIPRTPLGIEPTPLITAPELSRALDLAEDRLLLKLDAHNGFGLGGNKVRKLEFELSPPRLEGVTALLTCGGVQSNHARVTAAAAARLGLECVLVLNGHEPEDPTGNARLHRLLGARIVSIPDREHRPGAMAQAAAEVAAAGGRALEIPLGASTPVGALGYVRAAREFVGQLERFEAAHGERPVTIFIASSSCGTTAGLTLGLALAGRPDARVVAVSADVPEEYLHSETWRLAAGAAELLGTRGEDVFNAGAALSEARIPSLIPDAGWVGEGYAIATPEGERAQELFATRAGVIVDPVYTAKAASGLIGWLEDGRTDPESRVIFWHTGGHPAVLA